MRFLAATGTIPFAATAANSLPLLRRGWALNVGASLRAAADEEEELELGGSGRREGAALAMAAGTSELATALGTSALWCVCENTCVR